MFKLIKTIIVTCIFLGLFACSTVENHRHEEGGIGGTGNIDDCSKSGDEEKERDCY